MADPKLVSTNNNLTKIAAIEPDTEAKPGFDDLNIHVLQQSKQTPKAKNKDPKQGAAQKPDENVVPAKTPGQKLLEAAELARKQEEEKARTAKVTEIKALPFDSEKTPPGVERLFKSDTNAAAIADLKPGSKGQYLGKIDNDITVTAYNASNNGKPVGVLYKLSNEDLFRSPSGDQYRRDEKENFIKIETRTLKLINATTTLARDAEGANPSPYFYALEDTKKENPFKEVGTGKSGKLVKVELAQHGLLQLEKTHGSTLWFAGETAYLKQGDTFVKLETVKLPAAYTPSKDAKVNEAMQNAGGLVFHTHTDKQSNSIILNADGTLFANLRPKDGKAKGQVTIPGTNGGVADVEMERKEKEKNPQLLNVKVYIGADDFLSAREKVAAAARQAEAAKDTVEKAKDTAKNGGSGSVLKDTLGAILGGGEDKKLTDRIPRLRRGKPNLEASITLPAPATE